MYTLEPWEVINKLSQEITKSYEHKLRADTKYLALKENVKGLYADLIDLMKELPDDSELKLKLYTIVLTRSLYP